MLGAFLAQDLALFVLFFDLMLVPFYFLVGQWGGPDRVAATFKMVIYTLVGSLLMLAAAVATGGARRTPGGRRADASSLSDLVAQPAAGDARRSWIFVAFALAFLIKMPAFPFHGWMPDALPRRCRCRRWPSSPACSRRSPPTASCASCCRCSRTPSHDFQTILLMLALLSILYGSALAFTQTNARLILGYSSVAQLGFITLGIFALDPRGPGAQGALLQMVNHGLVVAPLFFIIALLAERAGGLGGHPRHGRDRVPRAGARGAVPDRRARDAGDARLGELRRRVPDPARRLQRPRS